MAQPYVYQPLPQHSIRLPSIVEQQPGQLAVRLVTYRLSEAPAFNALSYVWGPESEPIQVRILDERGSDAGFLNSQQNLFKALPFIKAASHKPIWIDAICINQRDGEEKARIVPQRRNLPLLPTPRISN